MSTRGRSAASAVGRRVRASAGLERARLVAKELRAHVAALAAVIRACCHAPSWDGRTDTEVVRILWEGGTRPRGRSTGCGSASAVLNAWTRCIGVVGVNIASHTRPCSLRAPAHQCACPGPDWWKRTKASPSGLRAVKCWPRSVSQPCCCRGSHTLGACALRSVNRASVMPATISTGVCRPRVACHASWCAVCFPLMVQPPGWVSGSYPMRTDLSGLSKTRGPPVLDLSFHPEARRYSVTWRRSPPPAR